MFSPKVQWVLSLFYPNCFAIHFPKNTNSVSAYLSGSFLISVPLFRASGQFFFIVILGFSLQLVLAHLCSLFLIFFQASTYLSSSLPSALLLCHIPLPLSFFPRSCPLLSVLSFNAFPVMDMACCRFYQWLTRWCLEFIRLSESKFGFMVKLDFVSMKSAFY